MKAACTALDAALAKRAQVPAAQPLEVLREETLGQPLREQLAISKQRMPTALEAYFSACFGAPTDPPADPPAGAPAGAQAGAPTDPAGAPADPAG
eukprot:m.14537 g.14537  ORF g.14537 m.14537 type:complete len:95 (-) comp22812_c0_seq1:79-363(-)